MLCSFFIYLYTDSKLTTKRSQTVKTFHFQLVSRGLSKGLVEDFHIVAECNTA